jgi:hypothetical protein
LLTIAPSRREIHELEKRKRERRKKREAKQRQEERENKERMLDMMRQNPMAAYQMQYGNGQSLPMPMPMPMYGGSPMIQPQAAAGAQYPSAPAADQSGNPYAPSGGR